MYLHIWPTGSCAKRLILFTLKTVFHKVTEAGGRRCRFALTTQSNQSGRNHRCGSLSAHRVKNESSPVFPYHSKHLPVILSKRLMIAGLGTLSLFSSTDFTTKTHSVKQAVVIKSNVSFPHGGTVKLTLDRRAWRCTGDERDERVSGLLRVRGRERRLDSGSDLSGDLEVP